MSQTELFICDRCGMIISDKVFAKYEIVQYDQINGDRDALSEFIACVSCEAVIADAMKLPVSGTI